MQCKDLNFVLACVASIWVYLLALAGAQTTPDPDNSTAILPNTTAILPFKLDVSHNESATSYIKITWDVTDDRDIYHFRVQTRKYDRSDIIRSPPLPKSKRDYIIQDLRTESDYQVCVYAHFNNDTDENSEKKCVKMATIALIRDDSLIALFCAIGYIILMILLGYLVWRYHKSKAAPDEEESEPGNPVEEEKLNPEDRPPAYLAPPLDKPPRSSIEDENIPYITPPVDQLSDEEKEQYQKSTLV